MAWLREIGFQFVDVVVKSDNEASADELDRNAEHDGGNARWIEDHRREQHRWNWKLEEQWDRRVRDSIGADDDQDDPKRYRGKMIR